MNCKLTSTVLLCALLASCGVLAATQPAPPSTPVLSVGQIVDRNVAARGGLEAWRKIHAMVWSGRLEGIGVEAGSMHFTLLQARPNRTRFEVETMGQKNVRAFDGSQGWKQRPSRGIRPDVQPFGPEEVRFAQDAEVIDGPLIDYAAHGSRLKLGGLEDEHGRKAWRLEVERPSGAQETVWVDADTFLELRYERMSYKPAGGAVKVTVYYHDYRDFDGVAIPTQVELAGADGTPANRMLVEQVSLNPPLDEHAFEAPNASHRRHAAESGSRAGTDGGQRDARHSSAAAQAGPSSTVTRAAAPLQ